METSTDQKANAATIQAEVMEKELLRLKAQLEKYQKEEKEQEYLKDGYVKKVDVARDMLKELNLLRLTAIIGVAAAFGAIMLSRLNYYWGAGLALVGSVWFIYVVMTKQKFISYLKNKYGV